MVFLPVLLFETALAMNVRRLMDDIGPILMMAIVAVVVCTVVVGFAVSAVSSYGLVACLLLGAIVATTDPVAVRSEEHTSELQSLMRISYAVFCLQQKKNKQPT